MSTPSPHSITPAAHVALTRGQHVLCPAGKTHPTRLNLACKAREISEDWRSAGGHAPHLSAAGQLDGQLGRTEHMQRLWPLGQHIAGGHPPDEGALPGLAHAKIARIQHAKAHLHTQPTSWRSAGGLAPTPGGFLPFFSHQTTLADFDCSAEACS